MEQKQKQKIIQPQPQLGLEAILAALATGGQPIGNIGKEGTVGVEVVQPLQPPQSPNPARNAQANVQGDQIEAILQALLGQGAGGFNLGNMQVG